MLTGSHLTETALVGVSDVDFWIVLKYENPRLELDILEDLREASLMVEMVNKRGRILLVMKWDEENIDLSIIPEKPVGPARMIVVQGLLMKKVVMTYIDNLDDAQKKLFKEAVLVIKIIKYLNSVEKIPGFFIELLIIYTIIKENPPTLMECYGAVLDTFFEEKTVCFSGENSCDVCLNTMNNPRFYIKI